MVSDITHAAALTGILDEDPTISEKLNIIKVVSVRNSANCNLEKTQRRAHGADHQN